MTTLPTGDFLYGVARPNWLSNTGIESVTSNMEFISISTAVDIRTYAQNIGLGQTVTQATQSQLNLNKLLEIISLRGQPVIMGNVSNATPFVLLVATEHAGGWFNAYTAAEASAGGTTIALPDVRSGEDLRSRIIADGVNFGFGVDTTGDTPAGVNDTGLTVTFSKVLT